MLCTFACMCQKSILLVMTSKLIQYNLVVFCGLRCLSYLLIHGPKSKPNAASTFVPFYKKISKKKNDFHNYAQI